MDARGATLKVKEYFTEANGPFGAIAFRVEAVGEGEPATWIVDCSFFTSMNAKERSIFRVHVEQAGSIKKVEPLDAHLAQPRT